MAIFDEKIEIRDPTRTVQRSALCRSRRELSNEYLLAKFGFDTAENEPCNHPVREYIILYVLQQPGQTAFCNETCSVSFTSYEIWRLNDGCGFAQARKLLLRVSLHTAFRTANTKITANVHSTTIDPVFDSINEDLNALQKSEIISGMSCANSRNSFKNV